MFGAELVSKVNPESISAPKSNIIHPKIGCKRHQENDRVWDRFVWPSWLHFRSQLGTMLAPFSPKVGRCCGVLPSSLLRCIFYPTFSRFCPRLYTILARFWRLWTPSGRVVGLIFVFFGAKLARFRGNWSQERSWMKSNILVWPGGMREAIE